MTTPLPDYENLNPRQRAWEDAISYRDDAQLEEMLRVEGEEFSVLARQEELLRLAVSAWKEEASELSGADEQCAEEIWSRLQSDSPMRRKSVAASWMRTMVPLAACACVVVVVALWPKSDAPHSIVDGTDSQQMQGADHRGLSSEDDLGLLLVEAGESCLALIAETQTSVTGSGQVLQETVLDSFAMPEVAPAESLLPSVMPLFREPSSDKPTDFWRELIGS